MAIFSNASATKLALQAGAFALLAVGCTTPGGHASDVAPARQTAGALPVLRREDVLWLERVNFGLDTASVSDYQRLGRVRYLDTQ